MPRIGPLIKFIPARNIIDDDYFLREMVTVNGLWNLELFWLWLLEEIIDQITSILTLNPLASQDRVAWMGTSSSSFSIKSAYKGIKEDM